jgi:hypothetical protein
MLLENDVKRIIDLFGQKFVDTKLNNLAIELITNTKNVQCEVYTSEQKPFAELAVYYNGSLGTFKLSTETTPGDLFDQITTSYPTVFDDEYHLLYKDMTFTEHEDLKNMRHILRSYDRERLLENCPNSAEFLNNILID